MSQCSREREGGGEAEIGMAADSREAKMLSVKGIRFKFCSIKAHPAPLCRQAPLLPEREGKMPLVEMTHLPKFWVLKLMETFPRRMVLFCEKFSEVYFNLSVNPEKSLVLENFKTSELPYDKA